MPVHFPLDIFWLCSCPPPSSTLVCHFLKNSASPYELLPSPLKWLRSRLGDVILAAVGHASILDPSLPCRPQGSGGSGQALPLPSHQPDESIVSLQEAQPPVGQPRVTGFSSAISLAELAQILPQSPRRCVLKHPPYVVPMESSVKMEYSVFIYLFIMVAYFEKQIHILYLSYSVL